MYDFELNGSDGDFFGFTIMGYQYPDEPLEPSDDNPADEFDTGRFLVVKFCFVRNAINWTRSGPILTTDDLIKLRDWMAELPSATTRTLGCYFTERELELSYDATRKSLSVHASYEFNSPFEQIGQPTRIVFSLDAQTVTYLVRQLDDCIHRFPGKPPPV